jgi:hypothetical protein
MGLKKNIKSKLSNMKLLKLPTSFTIFLIFFGISTLEAFRTRDWVGSVFWVAMGSMFLLAGNMTKEKKDHE